MTDKEILEKAIGKAIDNGWNSKVPQDDTSQVVIIANNCVSIKYITENGALSYSTTFSIYSHDFAKALWGEEKTAHDVHVPFGKNGLDLKYLIPNWQYHLQQMVIADDPIAYMGEHI